MPLHTLDLPFAALSDVLQTIVMVLFILSAFLLTVVVLLQEGKGGGLSGAFGGAGADAFGVKAGTVNKFTAWLGAAFLGLALLHAGLVSSSEAISLDDQSDTPTGQVGDPDPDEDDKPQPADPDPDEDDKGDGNGDEDKDENAGNGNGNGDDDNDGEPKPGGDG